MASISMGASQLRDTGTAETTGASSTGGFQPRVNSTGASQPRETRVHKLMQYIRGLGRRPIRYRYPTVAQKEEHTCAMRLSRARKTAKLMPEDEAEINSIGDVQSILQYI